MSGQRNAWWHAQQRNNAYPMNNAQQMHNAQPMNNAHRSGLSESTSGVSGGAASFRPDAPSFTPRAAFLEMHHPHALDTADMDSSVDQYVSSHYHLLSSTFMPPDTPPISITPIQNSFDINAQADHVTLSHPLRLESNSSNFHNLMSQQGVDDHVERVGMLHGRGTSDFISAHSGLGFEQIVRPRSRSDSPWNTQNHESLSVQSHDNQSVSNTAHNMVSPSPRRSIEGLLSYQSGGQRARGESHRTTLSGVPETMPVEFGRALSEDRGSPGGIKLPTNSSFGVSNPHLSSRSDAMPKIESGFSPQVAHGSRDSAWSIAQKQNISGSFRRDFPTPSERGHAIPNQKFERHGGNLSGTTSWGSAHVAPSFGSATSASSDSMKSQSLMISQGHATTGHPMRDPARASYLAQLIKSNAPIDTSSIAGQSGWQMPPQVTHRTAKPIFESSTQLAKPQFNNDVDPLVSLFDSQGGLTLYKSFDHVPFVDHCKFITSNATRKGVSYGVVKIMDIPYNTTRFEIVAFLGQQALMVEYPPRSSYFAVHIIMERSTAKSMDCYVEFQREDHAHLVVRRFNEQGRLGRRPHMGDRQVRIELSSQEQLMQELFPKTKCVRWIGQEPEITQPVDTYSSGFKGFVTSEEMVMTIRWAENPGRSNYTHKHLQRVYESMISLLVKYPWWRTDLVTIIERNMIFTATLKLVRALVPQIDPNAHPYASGPFTIALITEFVHVALSTPGFSERQRAEIIDAASGLILPPVYVTQLAPEWPFEVLRKKDEASEKLLEYYVSLLKKAKTPPAPSSLAERSAYHATENVNTPFGKFEVDYSAGDGKGSMKLAEAVFREWNAIENALKLVLPAER